MYEIEPTFDELAAIETAEVVAAYSPTFWDADAGEQMPGYGPDDPYGHPSWDVAEALTGGWDDPAQAAEEILQATVIGDERLMPLAETPTCRPRVRCIDEVLVDALTPEEELHTSLLALAPVTAGGPWTVEEYAEVAA